ncbi:MerR family transcriptional regulator [Anoxybacterium hadale]|uniref:MerR family transcriptional regulator n=1 Tax=Anoxybacterium hadale TaxID=3408580 RepID=A0ACD1AGF6_9FIRM|nr:MerR family transcriptional regulator [Clostridiales bacterium]
MRKESAAGLLKIGELAKATNTNVTTIKFYIKEGLLQAAFKTGPNMAYYDEDCVARIQLIKSLQKERYYPLSVIKRMLDASSPSHTEIELLDAILKADDRGGSKAFSASEASKMSGLSKEQISSLVNEKILKPEIIGRSRFFAEADLQIMLLIQRRLDAGIPFAESLASFTLYDQALNQAAKADVDLFINRAMLFHASSAESAARMICVSDETLDAFISLKRKEWNRTYGSQRIRDLDRYAAGLSSLLQRLSEMLNKLGYHAEAKQCKDAVNSGFEGKDSLEEALYHYHYFINSRAESLASSISLCGKTHLFFMSLDPGSPAGIRSLMLFSLRLGWLTIISPLLDCSSELSNAENSFASYTASCIGPDSDYFTERFLRAVKQIGGTS